MSGRYLESVSPGTDLDRGPAGCKLNDVIGGLPPYLLRCSGPVYALIQWGYHRISELHTQTHTSLIYQTRLNSLSEGEGEIMGHDEACARAFSYRYIMSLVQRRFSASDGSF